MLFGAGFPKGCWEMWLFSLFFWNVAKAALLFKSHAKVLQIVTFHNQDLAESIARTSPIRPSRSLNGPKLKCSVFCLDLEKYVFCLWKSFHLIGKPIGSQSPSVSLIAIYKSLFTVCLRLGGTVLKLVGTSLYGGHNLLSWLRVKVTFKRWLGRIPTVPLWTARPVSMYSTKSYIVDRQWGSRDTKNPLKDDY